MGLWTCPNCNTIYSAGTGNCTNTSCNGAQLPYLVNYKEEPIIKTIRMSFTIDEIEDLLATLEHEYISKEHELANEAIRKMQIFVERILELQNSQL